MKKILFSICLLAFYQITTAQKNLGAKSSTPTDDIDISSKVESIRNSRMNDGDKEVYRYKDGIQVVAKISNKNIVALTVKKPDGTIIPTIMSSGGPKETACYICWDNCRHRIRIKCPVEGKY